MTTGIANSLTGALRETVQVLERPNVSAAEARTAIALQLARFEEQLATAEGGAPGGAPAWAEITGKPSAFPPSAHSHGIAEVSALQAALDAKVATSDPRLSDARTPTAHTHTIANTTGLQAALDGKQAAGSYAPAVHAHAIADVTTLQATLDAKVSTSIATVGGIQAFVLANDDVSTAATTMRTLTGLVFTFAANATYVIDLYVFFTPAAATTGLGMAFDTSVAVTRQGLAFYHALAAAGTLSGGDSIADDTARGLSSGVQAVALNVVSGGGVLKAGANGGTAQLRWRPEVAAVATVNAGTVMRIQRVA